MKPSVRRYAATVFGAIFLLILSPIVRGSILPKSGTFRDVYHVNRAGVGEFHSFIIPEALQKQLVGFENKWIEMEVPEIYQPINPGPGIIKKIGRVTVLPGAPLEARFQVEKPTGANEGMIDVICRLRNSSDREITIDPRTYQLALSTYDPSQQDDAPDDFFQSGYTRRQLNFRQTESRRFGAYSRSILLRPGEEVPLAQRGLLLKPGSYEMVAKFAYEPPGHPAVPMTFSQPLDIPLAGAPAARPTTLEAKARASRDGDWIVVEGKIFGTPGREAAMFTIPEGDRHFLNGSIRLYSDAGLLLPIEDDWQSPNGSWNRAKISTSVNSNEIWQSAEGLWQRTRADHEGIGFRFRVRHENFFSSARIARIGFQTVTDGGTENITLVDGLASTLSQPLPPWGTPAGGCRLRIRMAKESFKTGEAIRVFYQAESDGKEADVIWVNNGNFKSHIVITVDGKQAPIGLTRLSDGLIYNFPLLGEITIHTFNDIPPGKHKLCLSLKGDPGIYTNLRDEKFRRFNGTLLSNEVELNNGG
jgi:hypothetical protein